MTRHTFLLAVLVFFSTAAFTFLASSLFSSRQPISLSLPSSSPGDSFGAVTPSASPTDPAAPTTLPSSKLLANDYHIFQTFNNCGPAALSMALSHYGITESQQTLGQALRPYQNPQGNNDDKSVTLAELAEKSSEYGFVPYHRPAGSIEVIKQFIASDMPVITRTWLEENEDIGHYRVVKGYDDARQILIQDDSLQGKNLEYSYGEFNTLWKKFNYEYLVLVPKEKQAVAHKILGKHVDPQKAWTQAAQHARQELEASSQDIYARFNLSIALFYLGEHSQAVAEFELVEDRLPFRTLWYQIEPIQAYAALGNYERVFAITDHILNNGNRAFSELYLIRGEIYEKRGQKDLAQQEYEKAVLYNQNLEAAQSALGSIKTE